MNKVEFVYLTDISEYKADIWELLCEADKEFIPHLSSREYESSKNVKDDNPGPVNYFEEIKNDSFLIILLRKVIVTTNLDMLCINIW